MSTIALVILCYLIGSLSFAVIVSRAYGLPDPHSYGSGNPGATNVMRTGKKRAAALTLFGDGAKGWAAVALAQILAQPLGVDEWGVGVAALAAFLGHLYPVFFGFKGGKGVATAGGIMLALNGWLGLAVLVTWLILFSFTRVSSLSALVAAVCAPAYAALFVSKLMVGVVVVLSALLIWRHRLNIRNLQQGKESAFKKAREGE